MELLFKTYFCFIFVIAIDFSIYGQTTNWVNLNPNNVNEVYDITMDTEGNCYASIMYHPQVYKLYSHDGKFKFQNLGIVLNVKPFFGTALGGDYYNSLLHYSNVGELRANCNCGVYVYRNNKFLRDTMKPIGVENPQFTSWPDVVMQDKAGTYFNRELNKYIYQYKTRLFLLNERKEVFTTESGRLWDFAVLDSVHNYALVQSSSEQLEVWKFHSHKNFKERIIVNSSALKFSLAVSDSGDLFLPSAFGLWHYTNEGATVVSPILDSQLPHPLPSYYVCWSVNKDILFVLTLKGIYASYDRGKTWIRPFTLNQNFPQPKGVDPNYPFIRKFVAKDTLNAYALIDKACNGNRILWHLDPLEHKWTETVLDLVYPTYTLGSAFSPSVAYAYSSRDCSQNLTNDGKNWTTIINPKGRAGRDLFVIDQDQLLTWEGTHQDSFLYKSKDQGKTWSKVLTLGRNVYGIYKIQENKLLMYTLSTLNPYDNKVRIYLSKDAGDHWELKYDGPFILPEYSRMSISIDHTGLLYSWYTSNPKYGVNISSDEGITWTKTDRFNGFQRMLSFQFDEMGRAVIYGEKDRKITYYLETNPAEFQIMDPQRNIVHFHKPSTFVAYDTKTGVLEVSNDFGQSWEDKTGNLPIDLSKRIPYFSNFLIDEAGHLYTSMYFQGIYRTVDPIVSVSDVGKGAIRISPNPAQDYIRIELAEIESAKTLELRLMDLNGRVVKTGKINSDHRMVDLRGLAAGLYIIDVLDGVQLLHRGKVVKL